MNTLNLRFGVVFFSLTAIVFAGYMKLFMTAPSVDNRKADHHTFAQADKQNHSLEKNSPFRKKTTLKTAAKAPLKNRKPKAKISYSPPPVVLRETYESEPVESNLDENWDEEAYTEAYMEKQANMSQEELAAQEVVFALDDQMMEYSENYEQDDAMYQQVKHFFRDLDEQSASKFRYLDLNCSNAICRLAVRVPDSSSQYEFLDNKVNELDMFSQNYADIKVNADDSRIIVLYLS